MKNFLQLLTLALVLTLSFTNCKKDSLLEEALEMEQLAETAGDPTASTLDERSCHAQTVLEERLASDPEAVRRRAELEAFTQQYLQSHPEGRSSSTVITIPVVFHVLYNSAAQNISTAQINSQLEVLNQDFRRLNSDASQTPGPFAGVAADVEIEFCLASQDPQGNPTSGITRTQTSRTAFDPDFDRMKSSATGGKDSWNPDHYLNVWVCNLQDDVLGFATFPGDNAGANDGVVLLYTATGTNGAAQAPFNLGRTGTHEVGHWLNLYHIWGDGGCGVDDLVNDTPASDAPNYGCSPNHSSCGSTDMVQNYMDYTDDACMNLFTQGQKTRMLALFSNGGPRASLLQSPACGGSGGGGDGGGGNDDDDDDATPCATPQNFSAGAIQATTATVSWDAATDAQSYRLRYRRNSETTWTFVNNIPNPSYTLTGLDAQTTYKLRIQANCPDGRTRSSPLLAFTTLPGNNDDDNDGCSETNEPNDQMSQATPTVPGPAGDLYSQISTPTDVDWYEFSTTSNRRNVRVNLTDLPADYDIYLYRSGQLVAYSYNAGRRTENLYYNTSQVGTYRLEVVGYDGAHDSDDCYRLRIRTKNGTFLADEFPAPEVGAKVPAAY